MQHTQNYDGASRLKDMIVPASFTNGPQQKVTYHYETNANLVNWLEYAEGSNLTFRAQYSLNAAGAATGLHYYAGQAQNPFAGNTYTLDDINRRTNTTMTDGTSTTWGYNDRNEVNSEEETLPGPVSLPLLQNGFTYDGIGNRLTATGGVRTKTYTPKVTSVLNQYASITQPAFFPVTGTTAPGYNVTVNSQSAERSGNYYWSELSVANSAGASFPDVTVRSALPGGGANGADLVRTSSYRPYMRPATSVLSYDADGNLTQDARWDYTWDAENRLISMTERRDNVTAAPGDPLPRRLVFGYDARSRRTSKTVYQWTASTSTWTLFYAHTFVWSGWHLVHEKVASDNGAQTNDRSYVWGIDHRGNAGLTAGTLVFYRQYHTLYSVINGMSTVLTAVVPRVRPVTHDLEGNVTGVLSTESAAHFDARFDYDCFGTERQEFYQGVYQSQSNGATMSKSTCPLRFSGQYFDPETKLSYYGYRYYSAEMGRWISRDPIEEDGGANIYGMVANDPVNRTDILGMKPTILPGKAPNCVVTLRQMHGPNRAREYHKKWEGEVRNFALESGWSARLHEAGLISFPSFYGRLSIMSCEYQAGPDEQFLIPGVKGSKEGKVGYAIDGSEAGFRQEYYHNGGHGPEMTGYGNYLAESWQAALKEGNSLADKCALDGCCKCDEITVVFETADDGSVAHNKMSTAKLYNDFLQHPTSQWHNSHSPRVPDAGYSNLIDPDPLGLGTRVNFYPQPFQPLKFRVRR